MWFRTVIYELSRALLTDTDFYYLHSVSCQNIIDLSVLCKDD